MVPAGAKGETDLSAVVADLGGPSAAVKFALRLLGGQGTEVKKEILDMPDISDNPFRVQRLNLQELESIRKVGELHDSDTAMYLAKEIPPEQPGNLKAELEELQDLSHRCTDIGMVLGEFYLPLARRYGEVSDMVKQMQDDAMENLWAAQVDEEARSMSHSRAQTAAMTVQQPGNMAAGQQQKTAQPNMFASPQVGTAASGRSIAHSTSPRQ